MRINIARDKMTVEGKGVEFLKCKSALINVLSSAEIRHEGRGILSLPLDRAYLVADLLMATGATMSPLVLAFLQQAQPSSISHYEARDKVTEIIEEGLSVTESEYWNNVLDSSQGIAVNAMVLEGLDGLCLFDEQGTGKTVMAIAAFDILCTKKKIDTLFVVCPKSMQQEWQKAFNIFLKNKYRFILVEGSRQAKFLQLQESADIYTMTFESVGTFYTSLRGIACMQRVLLVVDESFYVKNARTTRSEAIRKLRSSCQRAFLLCGTPAPNSPDDIINQFNIADNGFTFHGYIRPKDETLLRDSVAERIAERGIYLRRLKEEVLPKLPQKVFDVISVELTGKQRELYDLLRKELYIFLRRLDNTTFHRNLGTYFQKRAALLQACVAPQMIDPLFSDVPAKYLRLDSLIDKMFSFGKKKIIIWSFYRRTIDDLQKRYEHLGLVRIDGSIHSSELRTRAIDSFQNDPSIRIFLGNPAASGAGVTLHTASDAIYLSFSNQAAHYLQSLDRIHRRGQKATSVFYHLLVSRNTIEENEVQRLAIKEHRQHALLGDKVIWPSSLAAALNELEREL